MMEAILNEEEPITASAAAAADGPRIPEVDDPLAAMEAKLATLEGRLDNDANNNAASASVDAANNTNVDNDDDPMLAMFYRMEEKIEHLGTTAATRIDGPPDGKDDGEPPTVAVVPPVPSVAKAAAVGEALLAAAASNVSNQIAGKRKRGRPSPTMRGSSFSTQKIQKQNQQEQPVMNEHEIIISPSQPITRLKQQQKIQQQQLLGDENRTAGTAASTTTPKATRINWAKSPHKERLHQILSDWFSQSGLALEDGTGDFISDYKLYANKVGISRTTLFKYIHKDPSKRKLLPGWTLANENDPATTLLATGAAAAASPSDAATTKRMNSSNGDNNIVGAKNRGKRRLIDDEGVRFIVDELKAKADVGKAGFSRQEATNLIMERFRLTRAAASRQLSRHILPVMMSDGLTFGPDTPLDARDKPTTYIMEGGELMGTILQEDQSQQRQQEENKQYQIKRSIVMSGVYTQFGRALFKYYYTLGHEISACGKNATMVKELQQQCPDAKLSIVDVTDDAAVSEWAKQVVANQRKIDLVIAADEVNPEKDNNNVSNMPLWEIPVSEFDTTIDLNVKGVANMIRHFVPQLISSSEEAANDQNNETANDATGDQNRQHNVVGGAFVALSSNMGRTSHPYQASYCASKFAIEGMMKSVAMSLPPPLCAVPLAPGIIDETAMVGVDATQKPTWYTSHANGSKQDIDQWVNMAGPMILNLNRKDNGRSMSVRGFYTVRDRQSWIIQDGSGVA